MAGGPARQHGPAGLTTRIGPHPAGPGLESPWQVPPSHPPHCSWAGGLHQAWARGHVLAVHLGLGLLPELLGTGQQAGKGGRAHGHPSHLAGACKDRRCHWPLPSWLCRPALGRRTAADFMGVGKGRRMGTPMGCFPRGGQDSPCCEAAWRHRGVANARTLWTGPRRIGQQRPGAGTAREEWRTDQVVPVKGTKAALRHPEGGQRRGGPASRTPGPQGQGAWGLPELQLGCRLGDGLWGWGRQAPQGEARGPSL